MILLYCYIAKLIKKEVMHRYDGSPALPYYSSKDFSLCEERFKFLSGKYYLSGSRYYANKGPYKALIVLFHGIGSGRNAYIKEIAFLAKAGYLVYAFDYTGSMESQGPAIFGLGQVNRDERAFYACLDQDPLASGLKRYSYGHSWGGYASMLSLNPLYKTEKAVSISGFIRVSDEYVSLVKKHNMKPFQWLIKLNLWFHLGKDGDQSVLPILRKTKGKLYYIQGLEDNAVSPESSGFRLQKEFKGNPNFSFKFVKGQKHCPFLSKEAEDYQHDLGLKHIGRVNSDPSIKMDIEKATAFNEPIMKSIIDFYKE
jgi:pimeloyl-ACP methyl ester carboxylesterase